MPVIDRDLVRAINSSSCFVLIGSGPSCELGAPSWKQLAEMIINKMNPSEMKDIIDQCKSHLLKKDYPKIFNIAEKAMGLNKVLSIIENELALIKDKQGSIYKYISSWPFFCYLTTNFDNCLENHLENIDAGFMTRRNSRDDMVLLKAKSKNMIFKIHGDCSVPHDIVLTSKQYLDFRQSPERYYWREKILSVLHMIDLVIIGYSTSDPDFQDQLERAKEVASPSHPIFMFTADININEQKDYYKKYNIRIIPYTNEDGTHKDLVKLLKRYNPFIMKRESPLLGKAQIDESISTLASSMYLFTQLRLAETEDTCIEKTYASVILQILWDINEENSINLNVIRDSLARKTFAASNIDPAAMNRALDCLHSVGFIKVSQEDQSVSLEQKGKEAVLRIKAERDLLRERFENECNDFLRKNYPDFEKKESKIIIDTLINGLVRAYEKRGIEIAKSVFSNKRVEISDATDILEIINEETAIFSKNIQRTLYADLMIEVILRPSVGMKEYLAALSQGYFAYHALGLEPRCSEERLELAKNKIWVLDSSILLPILAKESPNHDYAIDLLSKMQDLTLRCCTSEKLFEEVINHAWWAIMNFEDSPYNSPALLQAAICGPGYKQNLFVDGYIKWAPSKGNPSFSQYMQECLGPNYKKDINELIRKNISDLKIEMIDFRKFIITSENDERDVEIVAKEITQIRKERGTYKGDEQCMVEAEVVKYIENEEALFLSQSTFLDKISKTKERITWKPEAIYRLLSLFSVMPTNSDFLYDCMTQDFYYAGFDIVDEQAVSKYMAPIIHQSRMDLDQEKGNYKKALGKKTFTQLRDNFERVPDEQKPFYSMQFAFYVAERESSKRKKAEERAIQAEKEKKLSKKEKEELERLRKEKEKRRKKAERKKRKFVSQPTSKKRRKKKRKKRK